MFSTTQDAISVDDETIDVCFTMIIFLTFPQRTNNLQLDITANLASDPRGTLHIFWGDVFYGDTDN